jgi:hypothetical protein
MSSLNSLPPTCTALTLVFGIFLSGTSVGYVPGAVI